MTEQRNKLREAGFGKMADRLDRMAEQHPELKQPDHIATVEGRRPTATRTAAGAIVGGPIGALIGFAWRKKTRNKVRV